MATISYYDLLVQLKNAGFFDVFVPFMLAFVVTLALLDLTNVIPDKRIRVVIAFSAAMLFITNTALINALNVAIPQISYFLVAVIMYYIALTLVSAGKAGELVNKYRQYIALLGAIVVLIVFANAAGVFNFNVNTNSIVGGVDFTSIIAAIMPFALMIAIAWYITR